MSVEHSPSQAPIAGGARARAFPDRILLPLRFDPARLSQALAGLDDADWTAHFVPQHYEGAWSALALRAPAGATHPIQRIAANPGTVEWEATRLLDRSPYFRQVLGAFRCEMRGARLMRLSPGALIKEHRDERLAAEWGEVRLHIPVATGPGVDFRLNGVGVPMMPGESWYLRLADPHSVANRGASDRVHLVIDAAVNGWLRALLRAGARSTASP